MRRSGVTDAQEYPPPAVQEEIVRVLTTAARINERERLKALRRPPEE